MRRSPSSVKATTDGVVRPPSSFAMTVGCPPSITDTTELVWAPENAYAITADYDLPISLGEVRFHLDYSWQDDQFALANTDSGEVVVADYGLLNGRISLADVEMFGGNWQFAVWGRNLTDEDSSNYKIGATANTYLEPLMWGGEIRLEY